MKNYFDREIEKAKASDIAEISVKLVGDRPCGGDVNPAIIKKMSDDVIAVCEKHSGIKCEAESGSTDSNIPMSLGVPSVCVGSHISEGAHTREEKLLIKSIPIGLKITAEIVLGYFNSKK